MLELRVFEHPNMESFECPICNTNKDAPVVLLSIPGTEEEGTMEAKQIHKECLAVVSKMKGIEVSFKE